MPGNAIEIEKLTVAYDGEPVLENVDLVIPEGKLAAIVGPNGAGKTTLIKSMLGLIKPLSGTVRLAGGMDGKRGTPRIAYVPQNESVDWDFPATALDVALMGRYGALGWFRRPGKRERQAAREALEQVGMGEFASRQIGKLSGGQRQRVFLARALAQNASIYLLDEPFKGVDVRSEKTMMRLLREIKARGGTVVVVHHDLHTVPAYFDWVTLINARVVANGELDAAFTEANVRTAFRAASQAIDESGAPEILLA